MNKELAERVALFRFGVIAPLVDRHLSRGERERIVDQIVSATPYGHRSFNRGEVACPLSKKRSEYRILEAAIAKRQGQLPQYGR